jgi:hypothetical protein
MINTMQMLFKMIYLNEVYSYATDDVSGNNRLHIQ